MWNRFDLKYYSKQRMKTNYWRMVLAAFIMILVTGGTASLTYKGNSSELKEIFGTGSSSSSIYNAENGVREAVGVLAGPIVIIALSIVLIAIAIGIGLSIFVKNPLIVGGSRFFMENHSTDAKVEAFGIAFRGNYGNVVLTMFLRGLYEFLWSLLLVIPGIIKAYEYRMIPYILADNPSMNTEDAFELSKQMMYGNKWDAFVLDLSFIGWYILDALTLGILGIFYVRPFVEQTNAELYMALRSVPDETTAFYGSYEEV